MCRAAVFFKSIYPQCRYAPVVRIAAQAGAIFDGRRAAAFTEPRA